MQLGMFRALTIVSDDGLILYNVMKRRCVYEDV